jgi:aerobic-type carbon monoxide dehydrogenase small subunit (CoxS/CutS family)
MDTEISFLLNGRSRTITTDPDRPLLEVLREDLQLTGSKFGCGEGQCRACTVMINGQSTPSCITPVGDVREQSVLTIEGLATDGKLHPVQQAFLDEAAFQCGYCTAGMIMGVTAVIKNNPKATEAEVLSELERHICRCCSYAGYRKAVRRALAAEQAEKARI